MKGKIRSDPFSLKDILGIKDKKIGYNKINQIAFATNLQIDKNNQIINFDIQNLLRIKINSMFLKV